MANDSTENIDVRYVAHLARLHLTDDEVGIFQPQMEKIMEHVHQLNQLDVDGVEPMAHAIAIENVFREDVPGESLDPSDVVANFPASAQNLVLVPKIIE